MNTGRKGTFIVLDGNDGSGKATQAQLLIDALASRGIAAEKMDFPGYDRNFFGQLIGECLAGKHGDFLHLDPKIASSLYALDRLESSRQISKALEAGKVVVADRFASSNQIHQGGKIEDERERTEFLRWLDRMEHDVLGIPRPDLIIYLAVPVEISLELLSQKRATKNAHMDTDGKDMVEEDRTYLERSHATAQWLLGNQSNWRRVECADERGIRTREAIHEEVFALVSDLL